jgi:hypothetical protein
MFAADSERFKFKISKKFPQLQFERGTKAGNQLCERIATNGIFKHLGKLQT